MMYNQNFSLRIDSLTFQIGQFQGSISHVHTLLLSCCEHISKCSGPALKSSIKRHLKCSSCIVLMTCISVYIIIFKIFLIYNSQHILIQFNYSLETAETECTSDVINSWRDISKFYHSCACDDIGMGIKYFQFLYGGIGFLFKYL